MLARRDLRIIDTVDHCRPAERHGLLRFDVAACDRRRLRLPDDVRPGADRGSAASASRSSASRDAWEAKAVGLLVIYAYAFFKFGWSYRLFNYTSILIGAVPFAAERDSEAARRAIDRAVHMNVLAGHHFSLGQRAFFFSVGFLGWFASAWLFLAITLVVVDLALPAAIRLPEAGAAQFGVIWKRRRPS